MSATGDGFRVALRPSRRLGLLLCAAYAGAVVGLASLDLPVSLSAAALGFLVLSAACDIGGHAAEAFRRRMCELVLMPDGECLVRRQCGSEIRGALGGEGLVHPWVVCFRVRAANGKTLGVVILPDMLDADGFRRLRVRLRHQGRRMPAHERGADAIPWRRH